MPDSVVQRLTNRQQFQAVMAGALVAKTPHFALHRAPLTVNTPPLSASARPLFPVQDTWLGVLLPKRWARRAVTRNAIRRQIYALTHENPALLPTAAWVVRLRCEFSRQQFVSASSEALKQAVRAELVQLLHRAQPRPVTTHRNPAHGV